jgi:uncharacterized protein
MEFEWDDAKAEINELKHGFSFDNAILVFFASDFFSAPDKRFVYEEDRFTGYGSVLGRLHVVAFTMRDGKTRLILARKANDREVKFHGNRAR